jgi:hypothetical protein
MEPGRWVRVRVTDQGSGMSPEIVEHLFDPYFTTKGDSGTGLGVPQVVAFMRASGGCVCVRTEPGAGTSFELRFPAVDQAGVHADDDWRQLDRWTNEGGNWRPAMGSPRRETVPEAKPTPRRARRGPGHAR